MFIRAKETGDRGEEIAAKYLEKIGYQILARNYHLRPMGEIDIVARSPDRQLVAVEVKAIAGFRDSANSLLPEDNLTRAKLQKMKLALRAFAARYPSLTTEDGWRMDLIAVEISEEDNMPPRIRHYENLG